MYFRLQHEWCHTWRTWHDTHIYESFKPHTWMNTLLHTAAHCNTLQHTTLQHTATHICMSHLSHTYEWVVSRIWVMSHVRMTNVRILHVTRMSMSSIWMNYVTHMKTHTQGTATHCNTLQHTATHYNTLQHMSHIWRHTRRALQHTAKHCKTLQHTATHCNTLQHTAIHCNTYEETHAGHGCMR